MLEHAKHIYGEIPMEPPYADGDPSAQCTTKLRIKNQDGELNVEVGGCFEAEQVLDLLPPSIEIKSRVKMLNLDLCQADSVDTMSLSAVFVVLRRFKRLRVRLRLANLSTWVLRRLLVSPEPEFLEGRWSLEVQAGDATLKIWPASPSSSRYGYNCASH